MTRLLLALLIFVCAGIHAQAQITKEIITGNWICKDAISVLAEGEEPQLKASLELLKKGFANAHFIFRDDEIFNLKLSADAPPILQEIKFMDNQKWALDSTKNIIDIGRPSVAQMTAKQDGSFLLLEFSDVPLILKMERMVK